MSNRPPNAYIRFDDSNGEWGIVDADSHEILWTDVGGKGTQEQAEIVAMRMQKQGMIILLVTPKPPDLQAMRYGDSPLTQESQREEINHPSHYGGDTTYEYVKVARAWGIDKDALLWTAGKYLCRQGKKDGEPSLKDLKKMRWYLDTRIKELEEDAS